MITVFSLVARTCVARPSCSRPICSNANDEAFECTLPPHSAAMSSSRWTRFSPKPGAWIAVTLRCPLTWLCTSICSAVPSTFSATITKRLRVAHDALEHRHQGADVGDLLGGEQQVRVVEDGEHGARVGDQVGRHVAVVELEVLDEVHAETEHGAVVDGDHAVVADGVQGLRDDLPDRLVVVGRDRGDAREVLQRVDGMRDGREVIDDRAHREVDAPLDQHRVAAAR